MNSVNLIGRFSQEPELRYTETGKAVCSFTLAVRNPYNEDGAADFIRCVSWGQAAEMIAEQHTGTMIGVSGRIRPRSYENNEGQTVYVTEVIVNEITFTQSKEQSQQNNNRSNNDNNRNRNHNNDSNRNRNNEDSGNRSRGNGGGNGNGNGNSRPRGNGGGGGNSRKRGNNNPPEINDNDLPF